MRFAVNTRSERYYYDGIRRIQEVRVNEVFSQEESLLISSAPAVQQAAQQIENATNAEGVELEPSTTPIGVEAEQLAFSMSESNSGAFEGVIPFSVEPEIFREYIYGPGDGPGGVDEIIAMFDGTNRAEGWWHHPVCHQAGSAA